MGSLSLDRDESAVLSMIDGVIFAVIMLVVTLFIFQQFGGALTQKRELEATELRHEAARDIQDVVLDSIIAETSYLDESGSSMNNIELSNISVKEAVRNYLYLKDKEKRESGSDYDLSELKEDIKKRYERCAWDVSRYHFAVSSSLRSSMLFVSDGQEYENIEDLPSDRSASQSSITIGLEQATITLYIWR